MGFWEEINIFWRFNSAEVRCFMKVKVSDYIDQIMEHDPRYRYLYQIRPGVTSYATLYNGYTDTMEKMLRRLELDLYYLEHNSLWFDAKILFKTFCSIVFGKKI